MALYTYQANDPAGTWRGIFMANDNGGVHSPKWRTHTPVRMITANAKTNRYYAAAYVMTDLYTQTSNLAGGWKDGNSVELYDHFWERAGKLGYTKPDILDGEDKYAEFARDALQQVHMAFMYGHGKLLNGQGVGIPMADSVWHKQDLLLGDRKFVDQLSGYRCVPLNGTSAEAIEWDEYRDNLWGAFVAGCSTYQGQDAFCKVLHDTNRGNVKHVIGTLNTIHARFAVQWSLFFWDETDASIGWGSAMSAAKDRFWDYWVPIIKEGGGDDVFGTDGYFRQTGGITFYPGEVDDWGAPYPKAPLIWRYSQGGEY